MVKAVIFDVDGTLLNTERIYMQAWKEAGAQAGFDVPQDVLLRTRAIHKADAIKIFQEALGPTFDYEALHPVRTAISEALIAKSTNLLLPGVKETLEALDEVFIERNLSPGGTADLLAMVYMLHFLKEESHE